MSDSEPGTVKETGNIRSCRTASSLLVTSAQTGHTACPGTAHLVTHRTLACYHKQYGGGLRPVGKHRYTLQAKITSPIRNFTRTEQRWLLFNFQLLGRIKQAV